MSDKIMPLSEAVEGYDLFDKMKVQKGEHSSHPSQPVDPTDGVKSYSMLRNRQRMRRDGDLVL